MALIAAGRAALLLACLVLPQGQGADAVEEARRELARLVEEGADEVEIGHAEHSLGVSLIYADRLADAIEPFERALVIWRRALGDSHEQTGHGLHNLGWLHETVGRLEEARSFYGEAVEVFERAVGPSHIYLANTLDRAAYVALQQGRFDDALLFRERALVICEETLAPEDPDLALALNNLAQVLDQLGHYAEAFPLYERALGICEEALGVDHPDTAAVLNNLGLHYEFRGAFADARKIHERALAARERSLGPDHPATARSKARLGEILIMLADNEAARPLLEEALAVNERVLGAHHPDTGRSLGGLAALHMRTGEAEIARPLFERSLEIMEAAYGPGHHDVAQVRFNLALVHGDLGHDDDMLRLAEQLLAEQTARYGPDHVEVAQSANQVAYLLARTDPERAARMLARSLTVLESVLGPDNHAVVATLLHLAGVEAFLGRTESASQFIVRAHEATEANPDIGLLARIRVDLARGIMHRLEGRPAEGIPYIERALDAEERLGASRSGMALMCLDQLALSRAETGAWEEAWAALTEVVRRSQEQFERQLHVQTESGLFQALAAARARVELLAGMARFVEVPGVERKVYETLLAWKGTAARAFTSSRGRFERDVSASGRATLTELRLTQSQISNLLYASYSDGQARARYAAELAERRRKLELELEQSAGPRSEQAAPDLGALAASLPERGAYLDFYVLEDYFEDRDELGSRVPAHRSHVPRLHAWVTRPDSERPIRVDLGPAEVVERAVREFLRDLVPDGSADRGLRIGVEDVPGAEAAERRGEALAELVWAPVAPSLEGAEWIGVSPDSFLGGLPFEVLPDGDGSYLIEGRSFVYVQDASALAHVGTASTRNDSLLCVGAVDFEHRAEPADEGRDTLQAASNSSEVRTEWQLLPATGPEARTVSGLHAEAFPGVETRSFLSGAEPTEERLKAELTQHSTLHLATHGFFQPEGAPSMWEQALREEETSGARMSPETNRLIGSHPGLLSGLVCAGANRLPPAGRDDGYLTAEEVSWLDLAGVDLVVLSACETGLGRAQSGEGLIGLRRAFRAAGAKTVISSLWSVGDESTAELMQDFYANLWTRGMGRLEALRSAQLAMLERNRGKHGAALPSTWGAFVLSGDWR